MFRTNEELFASFGPAKRLESHTAAIKLKLNLAKEKLPPWAPTQKDIWATTMDTCRAYFLCRTITFQAVNIGDCLFGMFFPSLCNFKI